MHFDWFDSAHHKYAQCKQKGFAGTIILVIVLILAGLAGAYYFGKSQVLKPQTPQITPVPFSTPDTSPAPNDVGETANWKTYTANKFSFKYPTDWYLTDCGNRENIYLNPKEQSCATEPDSFDINIVPNTSVKEPAFSAEQTNGILIAERKVLLDGKEVLQADIETSKRDQVGVGLELKYTVTRVQVGNVIYDLILNFGFVENKPSQKDIYNQILSTFRFD